MLLDYVISDIRSGNTNIYIYIVMQLSDPALAGFKGALGDPLKFPRILEDQGT
jgi:hypothetical protein